MRWKTIMMLVNRENNNFPISMSQAKPGGGSDQR